MYKIKKDYTENEGWNVEKRKKQMKDEKER